MIEQARQVFDLEEQKAKDVLEAIQAVKPVISLSREWGRIYREYGQIDNASLAKEIESIRYVIGLTCTGSELAEQLRQILDKKSSEYEASLKNEKEIKGIYDAIEEEICLYQSYAKLFNWIDKSVIERVLRLNDFEDKEEYFSMMFLLLNANIFTHNLEPLRCFINKEGYYANALISSNGWNWLLNKLMLNEL